MQGMRRGTTIVALAAGLMLVGGSSASAWIFANKTHPQQAIYNGASTRAGRPRRFRPDAVPSPTRGDVWRLRRSIQCGLPTGTTRSRWFARTPLCARTSVRRRGAVGSREAADW